MKTSSETESQKKIKDKGDSSMTLQDILTGLCSLTLSEEEVSSVLAILMEKNPLALADQNRELKEKREEMTCMGDQQVAMERELGLKCKELQNLQMKFIQMRESLESQLTILQLENTILKEAVHHHVGPDGEQTPVKEDVPAPAAHEDSAYHV
ncbi:hypothetical protein JZ751_021887 [Albula glossodonta]|uniref:Uncharacterized protein n=1 Tax=Albula glossodonta TaxID=121402 RepID=A0A8T2NRC8_9TELE|nr:hypothetical protein JZ751_021887 [Albula glossodonta]